MGLSVATAVTSMWSHDPWIPGAADRVRRVRDQGGLPADGAELNPKGRWRCPDGERVRRGAAGSRALATSAGRTQ